MGIRSAMSADGIRKPLRAGVGGRWPSRPSSAMNKPTAAPTHSRESERRYGGPRTTSAAPTSASDCSRRAESSPRAATPRLDRRDRRPARTSRTAFYRCFDNKRLPRGSLPATTEHWAANLAKAVDRLGTPPPSRCMPGSPRSSSTSPTTSRRARRPRRVRRRHAAAREARIKARDVRDDDRRPARAGARLERAHPRRAPAGLGGDDGRGRRRRRRTGSSRQPPARAPQGRRAAHGLRAAGADAAA